MINVRIVTTAGQDIRPYTEDVTVREILEDNDITILNSTITMLDGCNLRPGDIDKTLPDLGVTKSSCVLSAVVKTANAVEASVIADVVHVISDLKLETIKQIRKYRPKALSLYEEVDGKKVPVFSIGVTSLPGGTINDAGITFADRATSEGNAVVTMRMTEGTTMDDVKDVIGVPMLHLKKLEAALGAVEREIEAEKAQIDELINII